MENKKTKAGLKFKLLFSSKFIFISLIGSITAYLNMYATNYLGISITALSMVLMMSKVFDGFSDFGAGLLIDHTNSKMGQARPYELGIIGCGLFTILLFSVPEMSEKMEIAYIFVVYVILFAVFYTMIQCNEAPYLANTVMDPNERVQIVSFGSAISMLFTIIMSAIVPQLISSMGTTRAGWSKITIMLTVPAVLIGLIRFFTIKEVRTTTAEKKETEKRNLAEDIKLLLGNKYAMIFGAILLLSNIGMALASGSSVYYYLYVMGDVGIASIMAFAFLPAIIILMIMPKISEKIGTMNVLRILLILGAVGSLVRIAAPKNVAVVFVSLMLLDVAIYVTWYMASVVLIDTMDYGEWKFAKRSQGTIGALSGIASKVGIAVGSGISGVMLGMSGFDGMLEVQPDSAMNMIMALTIFIPALFCVVMFVLSLFYDLDKKLPQIRKELAERNA